MVVSYLRAVTRSHFEFAQQAVEHGFESCMGAGKQLYGE